MLNGFKQQGIWSSYKRRRLVPIEKQLLLHRDYETKLVHRIALLGSWSDYFPAIKFQHQIDKLSIYLGSKSSYRGPIFPLLEKKTFSCWMYSDGVHTLSIDQIDGNLRMWVSRDFSPELASKVFNAVYVMVRFGYLSDHKYNRN